MALWCSIMSFASYLLLASFLATVSFVRVPSELKKSAEICWNSDSTFLWILVIPDPDANPWSLFLIWVPNLDPIGLVISFSYFFLAKPVSAIILIKIVWQQALAIATTFNTACALVVVTVQADVNFSNVLCHQDSHFFNPPTEDALRRPMTYENHPSQSHPSIHI